MQMCYPAQTSNGYFKYAKGTFVGINEDARYRIQDTRFRLEVYPNPVQGVLNIKYAVYTQTETELSLYDITGSRINVLKQKKLVPGYYEDMLDARDLASGIYFIVLRQGNEKVSKKFLLIK
jgi:hypothetical protein